MNAAFVLYTQTDSTFTPTGAAGIRDAKRTQRYVKDIARVGTYRHPKDGWTLDITIPRLDAWAANFQRMRANGRDVEVVVDHRHDAESVRGYVTDMYRDGNRLMAVHEMVGDDAIKLAETVKNVSPWIERAFKDGKGIEYGEAITHSAIVQQPVIDSQEPFRAIAASLAGKSDALVLSNGSNSMPLIDDMRTLLGLPAEADETKVSAEVRKRIADATTDVTKLKADLAAETAKAKSLEAQKQALEAKVADKPAPDPDTLGMLAEGMTAAYDGLVISGAVTPAIAASLKSLFIGKSGAHNAYALSARYSGMDTPLARQVFDILKDNKPSPKPGIRTGAQGMGMSLGGASGEDEAKNKAEARKQLMAGAGITN